MNCQKTDHFSHRGAFRVLKAKHFSMERGEAGMENKQANLRSPSETKPLKDLFSVRNPSHFNICLLIGEAHFSWHAMQELALPWPCFITHTTLLLFSTAWVFWYPSFACRQQRSAGQPTPPWQLWQRNVSEALRSCIKISRSFQRKVMRTTLGLGRGAADQNAGLFRAEVWANSNAQDVLWCDIIWTYMI